MSIYGPPLSQTQSQSRPSHRRDASNSSTATSSSSLSASPSSFIGSSPAPSTPSTMTTSPPTSNPRLSASPSGPVFGPPPSSSPLGHETSSSPSRPIQHVTLSRLLAYSQHEIVSGYYTPIFWDIREHPLHGGARLVEYPEVPGLSPYVLSQAATQPGCPVLYISCDFFPRPWPIRVVAASRSDNGDDTKPGEGGMPMASPSGQGSNSRLSWHGLDLTPTASTSSSTVTGPVASATRLIYPSPPMGGPIGPPGSTSSPGAMMSFLQPSPPRPPLIPLPGTTPSSAYPPSSSLSSLRTTPSPQTYPRPIPNDEEVHDPITIQDILLAIHRELHRRISQEEWDSLSASQREKMSRKFEERCARQGGGDEVRRARARRHGVLRVDCLMEHTVFGGLTMSMEKELTGILTLKRPARVAV